jgi:hypothetical protein
VGPKDKIIPYRAAHTRLQPRNPTSISAVLHVPAEREHLNCVVQDISDSGAGLLCDTPPPPHTYAELYLPDFGRLECVSAWFRDGLFGVRFLATLNPADETAEKLRHWISQRQLPDAVLPIRTIITQFRRRHARVD